MASGQCRRCKGEVRPIIDTWSLSWLGTRSGAKWNGNYPVANLSDFRKGKGRPRIQEVKRIYHNPDDGYIFPLKPLYDIKTRRVEMRLAESTSTDPGHHDPNGVRPEGADVEESDYKFIFDELPSDSEDEVDPIVSKALKKLRQRDPECSYADYWEHDKEHHRWIFHHVSDRKALFVPSQANGGPDPGKLDVSRVTHASFQNGTAKMYVDTFVRPSARERMTHH